MNKLESIKSILAQLSQESQLAQCILTDDTGLMVASSGVNGEESETYAAAVSMLQAFMSKAEKQIGMSKMDEFALTDATGKRLICRPFTAFDGSTFILVIVLNNRHQPYRRSVRIAIQAIRSAWQ
jgi:predicted regulator of Ras-like GTPase activity (Roadblock/LC7/MglB family)